ncbi:MAG: peptidoglycan DD-metalloendopeptidase family protein [Anaerolineae bacterium]|jgi:murein DD-endopeptidase MepM/ murein hydrolase activator NlpD|nr:peptidoglycan DD-metalloendopeptidase family protein [Anaerolineae bacterium]MBT7070792.1 peptidoglycan DD-metalloendopeptidase family protein [Anaerolineae bacterium]MBT7326441.1 peptidoglycan DD-metalloendopeptidase family protein [Anaerolineae bacterium]
MRYFLHRKKSFIRTVLVTRRAIFLELGFAFALGLSACSSPLPDTPPIANAAPNAPTQVVALETGANPQEDVPALPTPTSLPPLRFTIPTPGAEPVSDWRPPLYPVPWAISPNDHFYFVRPIAANEINWPLASYRYGGMFFGNVVHTGIDIPTGKGTPIIAAGAGTVVWADWGFFSGWDENKDDPYGQAVAISHDFGYEGQPLYTVYAHMSRIDVTRGQWVQAGEQLGLVGDTGHTTGPHLHFEARLGRNDFFDTYNPELWIAPPQGWGVLTGSVVDEKGSPLRHYQVSVQSYESGRMRSVRTYGPQVVNSDAYYQENLVLSDLPAGWYEIQIHYDGEELRQQIQIFPGQVSYFAFQGLKGFDLSLPESPDLEVFTPIPTSNP